MKLSTGRMPLRAKLTLIFTMALLLPGGMPMSVHRLDETTPTMSASVATPSAAGSLEKEVTPAKYEFDDNEVERDYGEVGLTPLDDSEEFDEDVSPGVTVASPPDFTTGGMGEMRKNNLEELLKDDNKPEDNADVADNPIGLDEHDETEEDALNFIRLMFRRAIEEGEEEEEEEEDEPQPETIDEDDFSFSDLSKVFAPLIEVFSNIESGAPVPDEFFSWLPALKDLLQPKEDPSTTGLPANTGTDARRSDFATSPEPSLQIAPASPAEQPAEPEILSSPSLPKASVTPFQPTLPTPIPTGPHSPSNTPDSEERSS